MHLRKLDLNPCVAVQWAKKLHSECYAPSTKALKLSPEEAEFLSERFSMTCIQDVIETLFLSWQLYLIRAR